MKLDQKSKIKLYDRHLSWLVFENLLKSLEINHQIMICPKFCGFKL